MSAAALRAVNYRAGAIASNRTAHASASGTQTPAHHRFFGIDQPIPRSDSQLLYLPGSHLLTLIVLISRVSSVDV